MPIINMDNMLKFPQSTVVDKLIPKAKFVKASDTPSSMREQLTKEVEQIRLLYIIRQDTINVTVGNEVREIDVFYIRMKDDFYGLNFFCALDRLIPRHTIYILQYGYKIDLLMQHKQRTVNQGTINWKVITSELRQDVNLQDLNLRIEGTNMDNVYTNLLAQISQKQIESIADYTAQKSEDERIAKIKKQITTLEKQMAAVKQPRRKRELFEQIQILKALIV